MSLLRARSNSRRQRRRAGEYRGLIGFRIGDVQYAIDIARAVEVILPLPVVPIPHAPPAFLGVVHHRGQVLPVLDLRRRFGLPAGTVKTPKWIVVRTDARSLCLVADAITDVFAEAPNPQRIEVGLGDAARGIDRVVTDEGRMVFVLDVDRVAAPVLLLPEVQGAIEP